MDYFRSVHSNDITNFMRQVGTSLDLLDATMRPQGFGAGISNPRKFAERMG
jgi:hypothetical protein